MPRRDGRLKRRLLFVLPCAAVVIGLWALSYGRPRGVSCFFRDGSFHNVTLAGGAVRFQDGTYPRANPAFADVEGSLGWHAVATHPDFPERAAQSFCGVTSGEHTTPLRHHPFDKSGVHWTQVRFVRVPFWLVGGAFVVGVGILLLPGRRAIPEATAARFG